MSSPLDIAPLDPDGVELEQEPTLNVDGIPVPISLAAEAVRRCTEVIAFANKLLSHEKLTEDHTTWVGYDEDGNELETSHSKMVPLDEVRTWITDIRDRCIPEQEEETSS